MRSMLFNFHIGIDDHLFSCNFRPLVVYCTSKCTLGPCLCYRNVVSSALKLRKWVLGVCFYWENQEKNYLCLRKWIVNFSRNMVHPLTCKIVFHSSSSSKPWPNPRIDCSFSDLSFKKISPLNLGK